MQSIEELNKSLLKLYSDILTDKISIRKAMAATNAANTLFRGIIIQTQMCTPKQLVEKSNENQDGSI